MYCSTLFPDALRTAPLTSIGIALFQSLLGIILGMTIRDKLLLGFSMDPAVPGMDGLETLKRLRSENPDLQIITF